MKKPRKFSWITKAIIPLRKKKKLYKKSLVYCTMCKWSYAPSYLEEGLCCHFNYNAIYDAKECKRFKPIREGN